MKEELYKLIEKYQTIIIHRHINPDGDALGSQMGLRNWIRLNFPDKKVLSAGEDESTYLDSFFPKNDQINRKDYKGALVIVVDTANTARIAGKYWDQGDYLVKIDHHQIIESYGDKNFEFPENNSCSELISLFIYDFKDHKMNEEIALMLYLGIVTDTGRFSYSNLNPESLIQAANLVAKYNLNQKISNLYEKPTVILRYKAYILKNYKIEGNVGYFFLTKKAAKKFKLSTIQLSSQVNVLLEDINIKYAIYALWDDQNKIYKFSLRSKDKAINQIAKNYNGGGHKLASGGRFKNKDQFYKILKELIELSNES